MHAAVFGYFLKSEWKKYNSRNLCIDLLRNRAIEH